MKSVCIAKTKVGNNCKNSKKYGDYCGMHKPKILNNEIKEAITITWGDVCENNIGMQKLGELSSRGLNLTELENAKNKFEELGAICEMIDLTDSLSSCEDLKNVINDNNFERAYVLIIRNAVDIMLKDINKNKDNMLLEQKNLTWDKTFYSRKHKNNDKAGVVNKIARWNLCYDDKSQIADIANGKGTVIRFKDIICTNHIREKLPLFLGTLCENLYAEGNYYYDISKCGIGPHGDKERKIVIAVRLGDSFPLQYQWYIHSKPVGENIRLNLNHGDMYIMSEKSVGNDWLKSSILTLRHSAGADKYLIIKNK